MSRHESARPRGAFWFACRDRPADDAGFTLVEVMAALLIFAVISTAAFSLIVAALKTVHQNNVRVMTANAARTQVEYLRSKGIANITPGLSTTMAPGIPTSYTVKTTAEWVGLGQTASACDAAQPGQAYVRLHIEVTSPEIGGSSVLDSVIAPTAAQATGTTATVAISVTDQNGDPVSGVSVAATDATHATNSFTYQTGADGCLFVPQLTAPSTLQVTISKSGYVASTPTGTQATVPLAASSLAKPAFHYAPAAGINFSGTLADYPLPSGMPVSWQLNQTGSTLQKAIAGTAVSNQWPTPTGFTAWAGDCADATPAQYGATQQQFSFTPGGTVAAQVDVRPVKLRGLPANTAVTVSHVGSGTGCTSTPIAVGKTDSTGVLLIGLPNGTWTATGSTQTQPIGPLQPPAGAGSETPAVVNFTLANLDGASPSPSPSGTASPSPSPTGSP